MVIQDFGESYVDDLSTCSLFLGRGGYNTAHEIAYLGVPALLFSAARTGESQEQRIQYFSETYTHIGQ